MISTNLCFSHIELGYFSFFFLEITLTIIICVGIFDRKCTTVNQLRTMSRRIVLKFYQYFCILHLTHIGMSYENKKNIYLYRNCNFYKITWGWQGIKLTADIIWSKKDKEIKVSPLMQIRVKYLAASRMQLYRYLVVREYV